MTILSIDPSGTSTSGIFLYQNWNNYQITSFTSENWLKQAINLKELVQKQSIQVLAVETSQMWAKQRHNFHFDRLIKLVGYCELLAHENQITFIPISNSARSRIEKEARESKIAGLEVREIKTKGRPKQVWYFKHQELNEHEKDAVLIFYGYWVKILKKDWPFI